jgi:hypothetical protein
VALDLPRATTIETLGAAGAVDFTGVTPRVRADGTQRLVDIRPQPGRPLMLDARYTQRPVRARESAPLDREGQEIDPGAGLQAVFGDGFRAPLTPDSLTPADGRPVRPVQPVRSAGPVAPSLSELPAPTLGFNGPNGAFVFGDGTQLPADALTGLVRAIRGANAGRGPAALGPGGGGAGGNAAAGDPGAGAGAIARAFGGLIATRDPSVARSATVIVNPTIADDLNEARPDDATLDRFLEETQ